MLRVTIGETEYAIKWMHNVELGAIYSDGKGAIVGTACFLLEGHPNDKIKDMERISASLAILNPKDHYNNNVGRKVSLQRLLISTFNDQATRKLFWDAYFKMRNGKW